MPTAGALPPGADVAEGLVRGPGAVLDEPDPDADADEVAPLDPRASASGAPEVPGAVEEPALRDAAGVADATVGDEVPTAATPFVPEREPLFGGGGAAAPRCAEVPTGARPATAAAAPAPTDAESAATAATAADVGATERRTRAVGSDSVPWDRNIRRASVRRTALASGRCAGAGSAWSAADPTDDPANSDGIPPGAPDEWPTAGLPIDGPVGDRVSVVDVAEVDPLTER